MDMRVGYSGPLAPVPDGAIVLHAEVVWRMAAHEPAGHVRLTCGPTGREDVKHLPDDVGGIAVVLQLPEGKE